MTPDLDTVTPGPRLHAGSPTDLTADADASARPFDINAAARAVRQLLIAIGEDPDRDGLRDTPLRVARAFRHFTAGLQQTPADHLQRTFEQTYDDAVIVSNIAFASMCEHHLLPFHGHAHIAYLPGAGRVVGLSKLARTVEVFARRPQVQERLTQQIAEALEAHLAPRGVLVLVTAEHMCMKLRGVEKHGALTTTRAVGGVLTNDGALRRELLDLLREGKPGCA
jgi:GTP cyclohydrolase I